MPYSFPMTNLGRKNATNTTFCVVIVIKVTGVVAVVTGVAGEEVAGVAGEEVAGVVVQGVSGATVQLPLATAGD
jgi:hypothetical protein